MMLNMFPKSNSIAGVAPRELFTGVRIDYRRDCKLGFGEYVQVYAENDITNTMQARTFEAISLGLAGNMQGTYLFLSLTSENNQKEILGRDANAIRVYRAYERPSPKIK
jgi:hypothetical protein